MTQSLWCCRSCNSMVPRGGQSGQEELLLQSVLPARLRRGAQAHLKGCPLGLRPLEAEGGSRGCASVAAWITAGLSGKSFICDM
eukprot:scaffold67107_cov36-Prasinocladus_malaysianus.AAC.1